MILVIFEFEILALMRSFLSLLLQKSFSKKVARKNISLAVFFQLIANRNGKITGQIKPSHALLFEKIEQSFCFLGI